MLFKMKNIIVSCNIDSICPVMRDNVYIYQQHMPVNLRCKNIVNIYYEHKSTNLGTSHDIFQFYNTNAGSVNKEPT